MINEIGSFVIKLFALFAMLGIAYLYLKSLAEQAKNKKQPPKETVIDVKRLE